MVSCSEWRVISLKLPEEWARGRETPHVLKGEKLDLPPLDKLLEGGRFGSPLNLKGGRGSPPPPELKKGAKFSPTLPEELNGGWLSPQPPPEEMKERCVIPPTEELVGGRSGPPPTEETEELTEGGRVGRSQEVFEGGKVGPPPEELSCTAKSGGLLYGKKAVSPYLSLLTGGISLKKVYFTFLSFH